MKYSRQLSIELPPDANGNLGRECPRCRGRFTIDMKGFEEGGHLNLRCPFCEFISESDKFLTSEQREYVHSIQRDELLTLAEDTMSDILEEVFSGSEFEVTDGEDIDLGNVSVESPDFDTDTRVVHCDKCGFRYGIETGRSGVCPVCRSRNKD